MFIIDKIKKYCKIIYFQLMIKPYIICIINSVIFAITFYLGTYQSKLPDVKTTVVSEVTDKYTVDNNFYIVKDGEKIKVQLSEYESTIVNRPIIKTVYVKSEEYKRIDTYFWLLTLTNLLLTALYFYTQKQREKSWQNLFH